MKLRQTLTRATDRTMRLLGVPDREENTPNGNEVTNTAATWVGVLVVASWLCIMVWAGAHVASWALSASAAWLAQLLWATFAAVCTLFLIFLVIGITLTFSLRRHQIPRGE